MKRLKIFLVALGIVLLMSGCATTGGDKYLSHRAFDKPEQGISIPHPVEVEREYGEKIFSFFTGIMDAGLFTEVVTGGGVWPAMVQKTDGVTLKGYAYLSGISYWGDFLLTFVFHATREDLIDAKGFCFNRDAGWAYSLFGDEVGEKELSSENKTKVLVYNSEKFDEDKLYREEIFDNFGTTLSKDYLIQEIQIGSKDWEEYKKNLFVLMPYSYKMADGQIRVGHLPLSMYRQLAVEMPGFTGAQRWANRATINLAQLPFILTPIGYLALAGVVGDVAVAGVDTNWHGYYGRAETIRYAMAPVFRQICSVYKKMLAERNYEIERLKNKCSKLEREGSLR